MDSVIVENRTCVVCGGRYYYNTWYKEHGRAHVPDNNACADCQHWTQNFLDDLKDDYYIIVNGQHYRVGSKLEDYRITLDDTLTNIAKQYDSGQKPKGMGGAKYIIRYYDGRVVITDDLWHQGKVSKAFRKVMPNNAQLERAD